MMDSPADQQPYVTLTNRLAKVVATPLTAAVIALLLLAAGFAAAYQIDRIGRAEKVQDLKVQAQMLANAIAAPLAFDDRATLQEYLGALRANPQIIAAGAYGSDGRFVAGFTRPPAKLPTDGRSATSSSSPRDLVVTEKVMQGSTTLGSVYLHVTLDSWARRAIRYIGIATIVVLASILVAVLGVSYASLREAHGRLHDEIASRQQAEEALRQSQKMEALGQLTGGVAHDFNNLLMVASSSLELMDRTSDPDKLAKLKVGMRQAVDRGAKLTQQLLTFSRRSPLRSEVVDLGSRVRGMDVLLERLLSKDVTLEMHLPVHIWPVELDASELEVAILNIALNARDAMPEGGVIVISAQNVPATANSADMVRLSVSDSGSGIAPDAISKIFEPFYTTKGVGKGTGLGLSQVYGFARASGGDVLVESVQGEGTTISLLIPRSFKLPKLAEVPGVGAAGSDRGRLLLVEDDDTVADMVASMLSELGYEAERAASGDEAATRLAEKTDFDLVLSDMIMPGQLSGIDLAHLIGERWPHLPVVLMTGYSAAVASALKEGFRLISKPFSLEDLSQALGTALHQATPGTDLPSAS